MSPPDYEAARAHALQRLARDLSPVFLYHSLEHTRDDVLPAAERLAALAGVVQDDLLLLRTAACYHDIGFVESSTDHELHSARLAIHTLPRFGYNSDQLEVIRSIILATQESSHPDTLLEALMADADLDVLGRDDFFERNQALRAELAAAGAVMDDAAWYARQFEFLQAHRYHTATARALRDAKKAENLSVISHLMEPPHI